MLPIVRHATPIPKNSRRRGGGQGARHSACAPHAARIATKEHLERPIDGVTDVDERRGDRGRGEPEEKQDGDWRHPRANDVVQPRGEQHCHRQQEDTDQARGEHRFGGAVEEQQARVKNTQ